MVHVEHLLAEYHDGELSARRRRQVEAHLADCPACRARLSELERLSDVLAAYELPATLAGAETFRARVAMRLSRRARRRVRYVGWAWHLVPLGLICALLGLLGVLALSDLLQSALALFGWTGIDVLSIVGLPDIVGAATWLNQVLAWFAEGLGGLTWRLSVYLVLVLVFAVYVGWVGALYRARTHANFERRGQNGSF
jgi:predicted anti-sigma-YlaC factor YlaD